MTVARQAADLPVTCQPEDLLETVTCQAAGLLMTVTLQAEDLLETVTRQAANLPVTVPTTFPSPVRSEVAGSPEGSFQLSAPTWNTD